MVQSVGGPESELPVNRDDIQNIEAIRAEAFAELMTTIEEVLIMLAKINPEGSQSEPGTT